MPTHRPIISDRLPKPAGPYTPGIGFEHLVFVSGQGATDPATGELAGADVESQTEQCLKNVREILRAAGSDLQYVLRCGVFLTDMTEFRRMNGVYERMFSGHRPARTTVQVVSLPHDGLRVEIDAVAYVPPRTGAARTRAARRRAVTTPPRSAAKARARAGKSLKKGGRRR